MIFPMPFDLELLCSYHLKLILLLILKLEALQNFGQSICD